MFGSYYEADYYGNPVPYTSSDIGEPVPGWGVNPFVAGPSRLGVGAMIEARSTRPWLSSVSVPQKQLDTTQPAGEGVQPPPTGGSMVVPWWVYPTAAAVALGALGYYGTKKGWF